MNVLKQNKTPLYPYNRILLSSKKEWITNTCYNTDKPQCKYAKWNKSEQKEIQWMIQFI